MVLARLCGIGCVLVATVSSADASFEWLTQDPRVVHPMVWEQTVGFAVIQGSNDATFPTFERVGELIRPTGKTIALRQVLPLSDSGYHPPESSAYSNALRIGVLRQHNDFVQVVIDPVRGRMTWLEKKHFAAVTLFSAMKTPECCLQLLHLGGAERIEVHAQPRDDSKILRAFNPPKDDWDRATLEILEVRGGWMKIGNHFNPLGGEPEGFRREPGWIRMRDDKGRLVFWVVNPDSC